MIVFPTSEFIFRDFYTHLAKIKLSSEDVPAESLSSYVADLNRSMPGLGLSTTDIEYNLAKRQFAKDMSNIALGKLSQDDERKSVKYVTNWFELSELRYSQDLQLLDCLPITKYFAEASFTKKAEHIGFHRNVQVVVYSFVTAYARISMLEDMRKLMSLGADIYYSDTGKTFVPEYILARNVFFFLIFFQIPSFTAPLTNPRPSLPNNSIWAARRTVLINTKINRPSCRSRR